MGGEFGTDIHQQWDSDMRCEEQFTIMIGLVNQHFYTYSFVTRNYLEDAYIDVSEPFLLSISQR
jgi:hypothetical protein